MNKFLGIALIVFGLAIAIVPNFTDCASQGHFMNVMGQQIPMVCHWSARSEIAVGVPILTVGAMMPFAKRKNSFLMLSIFGTILGVLAILLPSNIIGTCPTPMMACNTLMKPAITMFGTLTIAGSLCGLILMRRGDS